MADIAIIKRNNKEIDRIEVTNGVELLKWFHSRSSFSMNYMLRYGGYSYEIIKCNN